MEVRKYEVLAFLDTLTFQQKKQGYEGILAQYLIEFQKGIIPGDESMEYEKVLHNISDFMRRNLEGFDDEWFWDDVFDNAPNIDLIFDWFLDGLPIENPKFKFFEDMKKRWDLDEGDQLGAI
ncbi:hypothetical protein [Neobacillus vireti]|uniref:Uncharacterized protein n=1 Tax=Neobacillus vireti LMG 21834 TaxID=1131730 RepID=A0AB94IL69_9BACI|nr:hypothetical protein [Neobacillus vireti]ETI67747.1 hypothetical protein BAVI_15897 [Neobacillus vireti LMG 21834]KLT16124.1 hypothetical protein AA980_19360 [Neobacillus vireti]